MEEEDTQWKDTVRENWNDVRQRITTFLSNLVKMNGTTIIVVSHGVWIETLLRTHCPQALGDRRVSNCDAFACDCVSHYGQFARLENVVQI